MLIPACQVLEAGRISKSQRGQRLSTLFTSGSALSLLSVRLCSYMLKVRIELKLF